MSNYVTTAEETCNFTIEEIAENAEMAEDRRRRAIRAEEEDQRREINLLRSIRPVHREYTDRMIAQVGLLSAAVNREFYDASFLTGEASFSYKFDDDALCVSGAASGAVLFYMKNALKPEVPTERPVPPAARKAAARQARAGQLVSRSTPAASTHV